MKKSVWVNVSRWQFGLFMAAGLAVVVLLAEHTYRHAGASVGRPGAIRGVPLVPYWDKGRRIERMQAYHRLVDSMWIADSTRLGGDTGK
jgi:hypothetical protein